MDEKKKREEEQQNRNKAGQGQDQTTDPNQMPEEQVAEDYSDTKRPSERDKIPTANQKKPVRSEN